MAVDTYVLGASCTCNADPGPRAQPHDTAVVTEISNSAANNSATVSIFEAAADAAAVGKHYVGVATGNAVHPDILDATALGDVLSRRRREITGCTKSSFSSRFSDNWKDLFKPAPAAMPPPPPRDPFVGKDVRVTNAIQYERDGAVAAAPLFSGTARVVKAHPFLPNFWVLRVPDAGAGVVAADREMYLDASELRAGIAALATADVTLPAAVVAKAVYRLVKALPASQAAGGIDAAELLAVARYAGIECDATHDSPGVALVLGGLVRELQQLLEKPGIDFAAQTWPSSGAQRLGEAIKRFSLRVAPAPPVPASVVPLSAPAPAPPQFPLYDALRAAIEKQSVDDAAAKLSVTAVRAYVADSCTNAAQKATILSDDYVASGAVQTFLRKAQQTVALIEAADLADASKVKYFFYTLSEKEPQPMANPALAAAPPMLNVNIHPDANSDEDESKLRTLMRSDAAEVATDKAALTRLSALKGLTGTADADKLRETVDSETMSSLHRLVTTGADISRYLSGASRLTGRHVGLCCVMHAARRACIAMYPRMRGPPRRRARVPLVVGRRVAAAGAPLGGLMAELPASCTHMHVCHMEACGLGGAEAPLSQCAFPGVAPLAIRVSITNLREGVPHRLVRDEVHLIGFARRGWS